VPLLAALSLHRLLVTGDWSLVRSARHQRAGKILFFSNQQPATSNQQPATSNRISVATSREIVVFKQIHSSRSACGRSLLAPDHRGYNP
jgi:hypothetical protein